MGAITARSSAWLGMPSIVVTLATLVILRESLRYLREGEFVRDLPPAFQWFGAGQATGQWLVVAIALAVFVAFAWGCGTWPWAGPSTPRGRTPRRRGWPGSGPRGSSSGPSSRWGPWPGWPPS
jgi:hypothetical protein